MFITKSNCEILYIIESYIKNNNLNPVTEIFVEPYTLDLNKIYKL